jgi:ABC-type multidrug transport system fused ATPase/permease subunit
MLQYGMRQSAELENLMTSVERVMEYGEIRTEEEVEDDSAPKISNQSRTDSETWPSKGIIEFRHVYLQYGKDSTYVLEDVNFKTKQGEKIGIVGRTGAGKSSLITALYRLTEPEGGILIDGHCTKSRRLKDLRNGISIIPQDPVLFTGTVRMNLDPFNCYEDNEIWSVLTLSNLNGYVSTLPKGLQHIIAEGGDNISVGQRQLMCLARALLRKTKILILDEATANVDLETDDLIQKTVRKEFRECTVITIAHRLHTILDYDTILVLQKGKVVENDSPNNLMNNHTSIFHSMCKDAGIV